MAIVMSCSAIVGTLTDVGQRAAVIQNPRGREKAYLNAGWWMGMGRAVCMYGIIFAPALRVGHFYGNVELSRSASRRTTWSTLFEGAMSPRSILPEERHEVRTLDGYQQRGRHLRSHHNRDFKFLYSRCVGARDWLLQRKLLPLPIVLCLVSGVTLSWDGTVMWCGISLYEFSRAVVGLSFPNLIFSRTDVFVLGKLIFDDDTGAVHDGSVTGPDSVELPNKDDGTNPVSQLRSRAG